MPFARGASKKSTRPGSPGHQRTPALEGKTMEAQNVWAVINIWTNEVLEETTHYQAAAAIENEYAERWYAEHVGPFFHSFWCGHWQKCVRLPFSLCRIDALSRFYPGIKRLSA
ncbi:TPA: hypothetical protein L4I51_006329 [Pseudomonas aeruginosa]|uniref:hypothetical protein n=1 Tax=Pseudomonas aeruginosa TaxID=287 RepID=UPI0011458FBD|nr:hypothetical protein [Pseudomonas aeruginosa]HBN7710677.1 hypothetical protein [Pseudomonas aeruginosa]HBN7750184.1 hypothetical protein [Pseudomonas aeruginosa]HBN7906469.1 hypothetical protein [Pseudomonas aeruginosa]HBN7939952.1 hypothetical protein [Pseudomonas aeruginosa]HBN8776880.1 hypothetical protein [Pseudomonas aeruginosa]